MATRRAASRNLWFTEGPAMRLVAWVSFLVALAPVLAFAESDYGAGADYNAPPVPLVAPQQSPPLQQSPLPEQSPWSQQAPSPQQFPGEPIIVEPDVVDNNLQSGCADAVNGCTA